MKTLFKLIAVTTIGFSCISCSMSGQVGSFIDRQTSMSEVGIKSHGQNLSDIIYTGKSKGRSENEVHETYKLRESQEQTKRDSLAWKLRKYLKVNQGGQ